MQRHATQSYCVEIREHGSAFVRWIEVEAGSIDEAGRAAGQQCDGLQYVNAIAVIPESVNEIAARHPGFLPLGQFEK